MIFFTQIGVENLTAVPMNISIVGKEHSSRGDFTSSEDDNVLVQGVATDPLALGFFGFAYYAANTDKLKLVPIDGGEGPVTPSGVTINNGTYAPLSRPIFIYVRKDALSRPELRAFTNFYITNAAQLATEVGYIPLPEVTYQRALARVKNGEAGSFYADESEMHASNLLPAK